MKKLRLDMDTLRVQSFDVVSAATEKGSVRAHAFTFTCDSVNDRTCEVSCSDFWVCDIPPG